MTRSHVFFCVAFIFALSGCGLTAETVHTAPEVVLSNDVPVSPNQPILVAIVDQDAVPRKEGFTNSLAQSICTAFPQSYKIVPETALLADGQISMKISIRRLGAFFNRSKNSVLLQYGYEEFVDGAYSDWQMVIDESKSDEPVISGYVGGPVGIVVGWSGITFLTIDVNDLRKDNGGKFVLSLAAERSTLNNYGFATAYVNAGEAWKVVQPQLNRFLTAAAKKNASDEISGTVETTDKNSCLGSS